jgi:hypothetical protein
MRDAASGTMNVTLRTTEWRWLRVPSWFLVALTAAMPARWLVRRRSARLRRRRAAAGLCTSCGYDIRATPGHCPECGHTPAGATA